MIETRSDRLLNGRLLLRQPVRGHRAGTDAVLLAAAAPSEGLLLDAGAGVGTAGLIAALRHPRLRVRLVERDTALLALARDNIEANALADRVAVAGCDITSAASRRAAGVADRSATCVIANPPWYDAARVRSVPETAPAHVFSEGTSLEGWLRGMAAVTEPGGRMVLIHRADALPNIVEACAGRFGDLALLPIHATADQPAIRLLVGGMRGSRAPLRILPPLVLHTYDGRFTEKADALHRGALGLSLFKSMPGGAKPPGSAPRPPQADQ